MTTLLKRNQVAEILGCSVDTVKRSGMVFTRVGKSPRYHPATVNAYLLSHSSRKAAWQADAEEPTE